MILSFDDISFFLVSDIPFLLCEHHFQILDHTFLLWYLFFCYIRKHFPSLIIRLFCVRTTIFSLAITFSNIKLCFHSKESHFFLYQMLNFFSVGIVLKY
jgi:hypothetical protein